MAGSANSAQNGMLVLPAHGMDLENTLFCGQSFSWRQTAPGQYTGVAGSHAARAWQAGDTLHLESPSGCRFSSEEERFWRHYFALDVDYAAMQTQLRQDETLARCVAACPGIRVLRQPFFDTLLSFIISQNNHIPRIAGIVQRLRCTFGAHVAGEEYAFPTAEALADLQVEDLAPLRAGFRAKYLLDAARRVAAGQVTQEQLDALGDDEARRLLCTIHGVGPKVADCVLLFALGRWDVAPMDVWMKRAVQQHFEGQMPPCAAGMQGIAQQYIFHWVRGLPAQK